MRYCAALFLAPFVSARRLVGLTLAFGFLFLALPASAFAATSYVDNTLGANCAGGSGTSYRVANRDCGGSDGTKAYTTLLSALTGSHVALGDTVYVRGGTYTENQINTAFAAGTGSVLVQNYNGESVTFQTGTITNGAMFITQNLKFKGVNWNNNNVASGSGKYLFGVYSTTAPVSFTFEDGTINGQSSGNDLAIFQPYGTQAHIITVNRSTIYNAKIVIYNNGTGSGNDVVNIYSSLLHDNQIIHYQNSTQGTTLTLINNTITRFASYGIQLKNTGSTVTAKNNIFDVGGTGFAYTVWNLASPFDTEAIADHSKFDVAYNYYYSRESPISINTWGNIITSSAVIPYIPTTNWFVDPGFNSYNSDYTLGATSKIAQRGTNIHPPDGTDLNGSTFGTDDVGAYVNPTIVALPTLDSAKIGWHGDSIMNGTGASAGNSAYNIFSAQVPSKTVTNYGVGGLFSRGLFWTVDQSLWSGDKTLVMSIGVNDISTPRTSQTDAQLENMIETIFSKVSNFGATPVWLGTESITGSPPNNTDVNAVNDAITSYASSQNISHGSILSQMQNDANWQTDYYATLASNLHPNDAGHAVIGHLAEYVYYQPSYTMSSDAINRTGTAQVYSNGKYRYTSATSSSATMDLTVTPAGGSFNSNDSSQWLQISGVTWNTSGTYAKEWTATGQGATTTVFTVGNLLPNGYYSVSVDNVVKQTSQADSTGHITYTYTGGWSTHIFDVTGVAASCSLSATSPIYSGQSATLSWTSSNAATAALDQGLGSVSVNGSTTVSPTSAGSYTYTLSVGGGDGATTTCSTTLTVNSTGNGPPVGLGASMGSGNNPISIVPTMSVATTTASVVATNPSPATTTAQTMPNTPHSYPRNLTLGDMGDDVTALQQFLLADGYTIPAGATGFFGSQTQIALAAYQKANNINPPSGYFGPLTRANIAGSPAPGTNAQNATTTSATTYQFTHNLQLNDTGEGVRQLQMYLNAHGFAVASNGIGSPGKEINYFGSATYAALVQFQNAHAEQILTPVGLTQGNGYFGPSTRAFVNAH